MSKKLKIDKAVKQGQKELGFEYFPHMFSKSYNFLQNETHYYMSQLDARFRKKYHSVLYFLSILYTHLDTKSKLIKQLDSIKSAVITDELDHHSYLKFADGYLYNNMFDFISFFDQMENQAIYTIYASEEVDKIKKIGIDCVTFSKQMIKWIDDVYKDFDPDTDEITIREYAELCFANTLKVKCQAILELQQEIEKNME